MAGNRTDAASAQAINTSSYLHCFGCEAHPQVAFWWTVALQSTAVQRAMSSRISLAVGAGALDGGRKWTARSARLRDAVIEGTDSAAAAVAAAWRSEGMRRLLRMWYVRLTAAAALALGVATAVINLWAVRSVNAGLLPQVSAAASRALDRDVRSSAQHAVVVKSPAQDSGRLASAEACPRVIMALAGLFIQ